jgi:hypothetical protein
VLKDSDDDEEEQGFETEDVTVTISSIKPSALAKQNFIGYRKVQESESEEESEKESPEDIANNIPGMETEKISKPKVEKDKAFEKLTEKLKSAKDVKRLVSFSYHSHHFKLFLTKYLKSHLPDQRPS